MVRSPARFTAMPHQLSLDLSLRLAPAPTGERYGRHAHTPPRPVTLHRFDPGKRMARFYSLHIERDLFGGVVLRRQWGRIGTAGRTRLEPHEHEQAATAVLERIEAAKRRRGYELTAR